MDRRGGPCSLVATWAKATAAEDAEAQMATNFFGMVRMVRACVPRMTGECRRVVNVGSIGGRIGLPYQARPTLVSLRPSISSP